MNEVTTKISKSGLKRFMALFLSLCLCLTMVQMDVLAGTNDATVQSGEEVKDPTTGEGVIDPTTGEGETPGEGVTDLQEKEMR